VLSGETVFSGRLPASMPRSVGQEPLYYNRLNTGRPSGTVDLTRMPTNAEEKYVSRYLDETNAPLFPFGHGLSYTRFEYSTLTLSANSLSASALNAGSGVVKASVAVSNVGDRDGVEVVQLYIGQRGTSVARPVRELRGFQRIALRAGESRRVEFELGAASLAFWNIDMKKIVEPAVVNVWVGPDAQSGSRAELTITE
jgi:beta-glucosidase